MLRSLLRSATTATQSSLIASRTFATKKPKPSKGNDKKQQQQQQHKGKKAKFNKNEEMMTSSSLDKVVHDVMCDKKNRRRLLEEDEKDKRLDVGPNGKMLFMDVENVIDLTRKDAGTYIKFRDTSRKNRKV